MPSGWRRGLAATLVWASILKRQPLGCRDDSTRAQPRLAAPEPGREEGAAGRVRGRPARQLLDGVFRQRVSRRRCRGEKRIRPTSRMGTRLPCARRRSERHLGDPRTIRLACIPPTGDRLVVGRRRRIARAISAIHLVEDLPPRSRRPCGRSCGIPPLWAPSRVLVALAAYC